MTDDEFRFFLIGLAVGLVFVGIGLVYLYDYIHRV